MHYCVIFYYKFNYNNNCQKFLYLISFNLFFKIVKKKLNCISLKQGLISFFYSLNILSKKKCYFGYKNLDIFYFINLVLKKKIFLKGLILLIELCLLYFLYILRIKNV